MSQEGLPFVLGQAFLFLLRSRFTDMRMNRGRAVRDSKAEVFGTSNPDSRPFSLQP